MQKSRVVLSLPAEMVAPDRHALDTAVLKAFGLEDVRAAVRASLLTLFTIRNAVRTSASIDDIPDDEDEDE